MEAKLFAMLVAWLVVNGDAAIISIPVV